MKERKYAMKVRMESEKKAPGVLLYMCNMREHKHTGVCIKYIV